MNGLPKQVIVIRRDLGMKKGKMVAQGAHASLAVFLSKENFWAVDGELGGFDYYFHNGDAEGKMHEAIGEWFSGKFTKIVVGVEGEAELRAVYEKARELHLPCSLIQDAGETQVAPGSFTAAAIGPGPAEMIDGITGGLRLL